MSIGAGGVLKFREFNGSISARSRGIAKMKFVLSKAMNKTANFTRVNVLLYNLLKTSIFVFFVRLARVCILFSRVCACPLFKCKDMAFLGNFQINQAKNAGIMQYLIRVNFTIFIFFAARNYPHPAAVAPYGNSCPLMLTNPKDLH